MNAFDVEEQERPTSSRKIVQSLPFNNEGEISFALFLRNNFLPLFEKIMELTRKYPLSDLFGFGRNTTKQARRPTISKDILFSISECNQPTHKNLENRMLIREIPIRHFEKILKHDFKTDKEDEFGMILRDMNKIFLERLADIEANVPTDVLLKLITYQEWVDFLLKLEILQIKKITDMKELVGLKNQETDTYKKGLQGQLKLL